MPFADIVPPPGVIKEVDDYTVGFRWTNTDKVRFDYNLPEQLGGWVDFGNSVSPTGTVRVLHSWRDLSGIIHLGLADECFLYVITGGTLEEVTPLRVSGASLAADPISTTSGSSAITVTHASHGVTMAGAKVILTGASTFNGVTVNGTYVITEVVDGNTYRFDYGSNATGTGSGGGGSVEASLTLNCGLATTIGGTGWGASSWGASTWGTERPTTSIELNMKIWSLDNWGEDMLAVPYGDTLYEGDTSVDISNRMTAVSGAPSNIGLMLVSPDRHVLAFGAHDGTAYDPLLIRWSDQEDYTTWTAAVGNTAGSKRLQSGNRIVAASKAHRQIIVLTDVDAWGMQFTGPPFTFNLQQLGRNCGAISAKGTASIEAVTYWIGNNNFYMYNGKVQELECPLRDFVFGDINLEQADGILAGTNKEFSEVWWFYSSAGATTNDRYIVYNYKHNIWYNGTMDRTAWIDRDLYDNPVAIDSAGQLYYHEEGSLDFGNPMAWECETGTFEAENGDEFVFTDKFIPANEALSENINFTVLYKRYPQDATELTKTRSITPSTRFVRPRIRGRQMRFKWANDTNTGKWQLGKWRAEVQGDGDR